MAKSNKTTGGLKLDSKGNAGLLIIFGVVFVVIMAMVYILSSMVLSGFNDEVQASDDFNAVAKNTTQTLTTQSTTIFDSIVLTFMIGCWIALLVSAWFMEANPLMFITSVILVAIILWVAMVVGNSYEEFTADSEISVFADDFPKTNFIIENIVVLVIAMAFSSIVTIYGRSIL